MHGAREGASVFPGSPTGGGAVHWYVMFVCLFLFSCCLVSLGVVRLFKGFLFGCWYTLLLHDLLLSPVDCQFCPLSVFSGFVVY